MGAKTGLVLAIVGGLLVHTSGARAGENTNPVLDAKPVAPGVAPALSLTEPRMVHAPRAGFLIAGVVVAVPAYLLQMLSSLAYSPTIQTYDQPCSYCAKAAALTLIPIVGPWLGSREAGTPDDEGALIFGGVEAAAVAMLIVGLVGHDVPQQPEEAKVSLAPFVTPQTEGLSLRMRW